MNFRRVEADIDLDAVRHNIEAVQALNPKDRKTLLVLKADAYGHGAVPLAQAVGDLADYFGTACVDEALEIRRAGIRKPVLILGYTDPADYPWILQEDITAAIYSAEDAAKLSDLAKQQGKKARVHVACDSGMGRIGFSCTEEGIAEAEKLFSMPGLDVEGVFTHYAKADEQDKAAAHFQYKNFISFIKALEKRGCRFRLKHIDNSAGAMELHSADCNMMRLGIVIYGLYPSDEVRHDIGLQPAMALRSRIVHIKEMPAGRGISYGWDYVTGHPTRVATISAGYADGYPRALSGIGHVLIHGKEAPILGRICMDQFMADVSNIPEARLRDSVTLMGRDGEKEITAEEIAAPANSFNYELVCNVARRVPRVYFTGGREKETVNYLF